MYIRNFCEIYLHILALNILKFLYAYIFRFVSNLAFITVPLKVQNVSYIVHNTLIKSIYKCSNTSVNHCISHI